jgi:GNAT superfamily N-acetyltransferase
MLAYVDDQLAGWVAFGQCRDADKHANWGEVEAVYLLPSFWRKGIGEHLMACACGALREAGYLHASLWVLTENCQARAIYEQIGFVCDGVVKEFELGGARLSETRYYGDLSGACLSVDGEGFKNVER